MADVTFDCPECSHNLIVDEQAAGLVVACPECGTQIRVPGADAAAADVPLKAESLDPEAAALAEPVPAPEMDVAAAEYRVVALADGENGDSRITAEAVQRRLNELAREGWRLCSATTLQPPASPDQAGQELLLILQR